MKGRSGASRSINRNRRHRSKRSITCKYRCKKPTYIGGYTPEEARIFVRDFIRHTNIYIKPTIYLIAFNQFILQKINELNIHVEKDVDPPGMYVYSYYRFDRPSDEHTLDKLKEYISKLNNNQNNIDSNLDSLKRIMNKNPTIPESLKRTLGYDELTTLIQDYHHIHFSIKR